MEEVGLTTEGGAWEMLTIWAALIGLKPPAFLYRGRQVEGFYYPCSSQPVDRKDEVRHIAESFQGFFQVTAAAEEVG